MTAEVNPQFSGYQMKELMYDGDGFNIWMDEYEDLWISNDYNHHGYSVPNGILASIWEELKHG